MLIGLGYKARSGKDTAADILAAKYGFQKMAFADALKSVCAAAFGFSREQLYGGLKEVEDTFWGCTPRLALQRTGEESFCQVWGQGFWVRVLHRQVEPLLKAGQHVVVTDVRHPVEAEAILRWGGIVVRVDRRVAGATGGVQNHVSEVSLDTWPGWTEVLDNNGSLADLEGRLDALVGCYGLTRQLELFERTAGTLGGIL